MKRHAAALLATTLLPLLVLAGVAHIVVLFLRGAVAAANTGNANCVIVPDATTATDNTATDTNVPDAVVPDTEAPEGTGAVSLDLVLATIRWQESRNDYQAHAEIGSASGAYQFVDGTWDSYAGYPHAWMAPAAIQDERARMLVEPILRRWGLFGVPIGWYYPAALANPNLLDTVPHPEYGNTLTVRQNQQRWLDTYRQLAGGNLPIEGCDFAGGGVTGIGTQVPAGIAPVIAYAYAQLGKPYVWGGAGPDVFDCSGLSLRAYQQIRIDLPHNAATQAHYGAAINWRTDAIRPGDLIFHRGSVPVHDNGHVGIAISATHWIVAPKTGDVVSVRPIPFDRIQNVRRLVQPKE